MPGIGIEHVGAFGNVPAVMNGGQIDPVAQHARVRNGRAEHPEPGHPAVGIDVQPDMGEGLVVVDPVGVRRCFLGRRSSARR